jgi:cation:H+ antiporter
MTYFLFIIGFVILILGADFLVKAASAIGARLKIPDIVIGLTIVSLGTSLPEVVINVFASAEGETELAVSNILGSNLMNILLVVGTASVIYPMVINRKTTIIDIPTSLFSVLILGLLANDSFFGWGSESVVSRIDGLVFILLIIAYIAYSFRSPVEDIPLQDEEVMQAPVVKSLPMLGAGLVMLFLGGRWIVNGTYAISDLLGISNSEVGLVVVATATSLPELATSIMAAIRKNPGIAVGNAIGSCIFNIFLVLGISSLITPLPFVFASNIDLAMVALANVMLFVFVFTGKGNQISRFEGLLMIVSYFAYMVFRLRGF